MTSPACTVADGAGTPQVTPPCATVTPTNVVTIQLADTAGVDVWSIACVNTDETQDAATINAGLSVNGTTKTATFTAPAGAYSLIFESVVQAGQDVNGNVRADYRTTFKVASPTNDGKILVAANEELENHATFGWVGSLNDAIRNQAAGSLPTSIGQAVAPLVDGSGTPAWLTGTGTAGDVLYRDGSGNWVIGQLPSNLLGTAFAISSFAKTNPNTTTVLYERGDTITGLTASATYAAGPPTAASVAKTLGGSVGGDVDTLAWVAGSAPFASWTTTGSIKREGTDAGADPSLTNTLSATKGASSLQLAATAITWTSRVFYGPSANTSLTEAQIEALATNVLRASRSGSYAMTLSSQYGYMCWPDTYGTPTVVQGGFPSAWSKIGTVSVTNANGVTRTYGVWRSDGLLTGTLTFTVT